VGLKFLSPLRSAVSSGGVTVLVDQSSEDLDPLDSFVARPGCRRLRWAEPVPTIGAGDEWALLR
jgi:hypothetical protein